MHSRTMRGALLAMSVVVFVASGCKPKVSTIDGLAGALTTRGLKVQTVEPTADEKLVLEKFRALSGATAPSDDEFRTLRIDEVDVQVTRHSMVVGAKSKVTEVLEDEAKRAKRHAAQSAPHGVTRAFSHGPFSFVINHWTVSAAPGGRIDMGSYTPIDIDPATEQRIESTIKSIKVASLF